MNILVIAPHPDDEAIGCGGTICRHVDRGDRVSVAFLTSGELGLKHLPKDEAWRVREDEAGKAAAHLGIADLHFLRAPDWFVGDTMDDTARKLAEVMDMLHPELLYVPHPLEWHPDHQAALPLAACALTRSRATPSVRTYEVWTPLSTYVHVKDISQYMSRKLRAIRLYRSQLSSFRYDRAAAGLNQYRGSLAGHCRYAEVFGSVELNELSAAHRNQDGDGS